MVLNRLNRTTFKHVVLNLLVILLFSLILVGCNQKLVEEVTLDKTEVTLTVGEDVQVTATVKPSDADDPSVTWSSDKADIASVTAGKITAHKEGTAVITAKAGEKQATVSVIVNAKTFTVSFSGVELDDLTIKDGEKVAKPADPTKEHSTFGGWFKDSACTEAFDFDAAITADTTVYAKWTSTEYSITFDAKGGSTVAAIQVISGEKAVKPADPTLAGYHFVNWYKDNALTEVYSFDTVVTNNFTLYAKFEINQYDVTFNANGGSAVTAAKVNHGEKATKPEDPTFTNYVFGGWYKEAELTNAFDFETEVITANVTVYAKWTMVDTLAKLEFELNGGAWSAQAIAGFITATPTTTHPIKAFNGAYLTFAGTSLNLFPGATYGGNPWAYEIGLKKNADGLYEIKALFPEKGDKKTDFKVYDFALVSHSSYAAGDTFMKTLTVGQVIAFEGFDPATQKEVDLVGCTVKVYEAGTKPDYANSFFTKGNLLPKPSKYRQAFEGWYDNPELTGTEVTNVVTSGKLYAKWVAPFYAVSFNTNGGDAVLTQYVDFELKATLPLEPNKDGHMFAGWFKDAELTVPFDFKTEVIRTETTVYAKWIENIEAVADYNAVWNEELGTWYIKVTVPNENLDAETVKSIKVSKKAGKFLNALETLTPNTDPVLWFGVAKENGDLTYKDAGEYAYEVVRKDETSTYYGFDFNYDPALVVGVPTNIVADVDYEVVYNPTRAAYYIEVSVPNELLDAASVKSITIIREAGQYLTDEVILTPDTDTVLWFGVADGYRLPSKQNGIYSYKVERQDGSMFVFEFEFDNALVTGIPEVEIQGATIDYNAILNEELETYYVKVNSVEALDDTTIKSIALVRKAGALVEPVELTPDADSVLWFGVALADKDLTYKENGQYVYLVTRIDNSQYLLVLDYDRTQVTGVYYGITYNANGGTMLPVLTSKYAIIDAFLADFYAYVNPTESLSDFVHGVGLTTGYKGTWTSAYKAKLYAGYRPTKVDEAYFISSAAYVDKWLPFFDFMDKWVSTVNNTQFFYDGTYVGGLRIDAYIRNTTTGAAFQPLYSLDYTYDTQYSSLEPQIKLATPQRFGYAFMGWYENAELTGEPVSNNYETTVKGEKTFYAKWVELNLGNELFFSEYGEGSSSNKWLEIYNPTDAAVDLTGYKVVAYNNGATIPTNSIELTGTLAAGDVYVIYNADAAQAVKDAGDVTSTVTYFNGNDFVGLYNDGVLIDSIGVFGNNPGTNWGAGSGKTSEFTLIRKPGITGNPRYNKTEWEALAVDTFTNVGSHTFVAPQA